MVDERVGKLARLLVEYSIRAGKGDQVLVSGEVGAAPLIRALYAHLLQVGATPVIQINLPGMQEIFFQEAQEFHYEEIPRVTRAIYEGVDAQIGILSPSNTMALANVDPEKQQALQMRNKPLSEMMLEKDRWVLTLFPTEALAQEAAHGPLRVRGVRVRGYGTRRGRPRALLDGEVRRAGPARREARGCARYPHRRSRART